MLVSRPSNVQGAAAAKPIHSQNEKTNKMCKSLRQMFLSSKIVENKQQQNGINSSLYNKPKPNLISTRFPFHLISNKKPNRIQRTHTVSPIQIACNDTIICGVYMWAIHSLQW